MGQRAPRQVVAITPKAHVAKLILDQPSQAVTKSEASREVHIEEHPHNKLGRWTPRS